MKYTPVIGLEVHVELATASKMFCGCPADHFGKAPNTQTCPVCLGLPGALPVPNRKAVDWTILLGLALNCEISLESKFDRKHYFYPDLPKVYQISQYDQPLCENGEWRMENGETVRIRRVHLEEDTGKLIHERDKTLVDFNRSGVPLCEIVTEPDFGSVDQVDAFVKKLQRIVRYLGISGADMEKGSMRLEPSISLSEDGTIPKYRVELKNINSFRFARKALEYEIDRQQHEEHMQETRGWNEAKNVTVAQRQKEEAHDYGYFPEPDIPPMLWGKSQIASLKSQIGEMPEEKKERFMKQYGLTTYDANLLVETKERAEFFESVVSFGSPKTIANIMINKKARTKEEVMRYLQTPVGVSEDELAKVIKQVLGDNPKAVADYKSGKEPVLMFLVGQAMKMTQGKAAADIIKRKLLELLKK